MLVSTLHVVANGGNFFIKLGRFGFHRSPSPTDSAENWIRRRDSRDFGVAPSELLASDSRAFKIVAFFERDNSFSQHRPAALFLVLLSIGILRLLLRSMLCRSGFNAAFRRGVLRRAAR